MNPPQAILTDIEGTTTPIAFVHEVLFPFARQRLTDWCARHPDRPILDEVTRLAPGVAPALTLLDWMARDAKITSLKTIQGMIWAEGYASGEILGALYEDVPPALRRWAKAGLRLYVYSSGSEAAQRQIFGSSVAGDLTPVFQGFFDTRIGPKRVPESYADIARAINLPGPEILFLSDVEQELDAAAAAGLQTCQLVRPADPTIASARHATASDFFAVARQFGLPQPS